MSALLWMAASAMSFSCMAIYVKRLAPVIPQFELVFFRSAVNLAWMLGWMLLRRESLFPEGKPLLVFRGLAGFAGATCLIYSISHLPLPIATMLSWSSPIFVILFSTAVLKEALPARSSFFIPLAFAGLVLLLNRGAGPASPVSPRAAAIGILGAAFGGMAYVAVRAATARIGVNAIVLYFVGISTLVSAPLAARDFLRPDRDQAIQLLCLGTFATIGQLAMTRAYRFAPAGVVSMMSLLNPVFGAAFGVCLFGEVLGPVQWSGMALMGIAIGFLVLQGGKPGN